MLILGTVILAVLAWWGSTGLIVLAVRQCEERQGLVMVAATVAAAFGIAAILASADVRSASGAYAAFLGALAIWGFFETAFLLGWITGPRREPCPVDCTPIERFRHASATVIHHELSLAASLAGLAFLLSGAANRVALMTFALLWVMRLAAKFILFLGARHSFSDLMPDRLAYLQSYFRTDRTTALFPLVLTSGAIAFGLIIHALSGEVDPFMITSHALAATFLGLALTELALLNLPVRDSALWTWAVPQILPRPLAPGADGAPKRG
ncbi:MAG: putative photosynthetic complex assembly protein PuhE [Rhizobiaceae bacterium]|jgi:putative photosynthetic complex assembly protein 2|nr:putative photosynthetic complex assembly protein PuhE [Rhizobiaceae bacterium]